MEKNSSWFLRVISTALVFIQTITALIPVAVLASSVSSAGATEKTTPDQAPQTVIHRPPMQAPRSILPQFSSPPTAAEIFSAHIFPVALVPVGNPTPEENKALVDLLTVYVQRTNYEDQSLLTGFIKTKSGFRMECSLIGQRGHSMAPNGLFFLRYLRLGTGMEFKPQATDYKAKALADRAVGELAQSYAWIGGYDKLEALFTDIGDRTLIGSAAEMLASARDGLVVMNDKPEGGFLCGPFALQQILSETQRARSEVLVGAVSTRQGVSLAQLKDLADKAGMHMQLAKRTSGDFLINSVVHWKLNHYGALLQEDHGRYLLRDATFSKLYGNEMWISKAALEQESDGYFLVQDGILPVGWQKISPAEARNVWGKGAPQAKDQDCGCKTGCNGGNSSAQAQANDAAAGGGYDQDSGNSFAMARYQISLMLAGLYITDIPLFYHPPVGPAVQFSLAYNQRDSFLDAVPNYSNLGPQWSLDWFTYISDSGSSGSRTTVTRYWNSVGQITETISNATTGTYFSDRFGDSLQYTATNDSYALTHSDGSQDVFGYPSTILSGPRKMYLTKRIDDAGNALSFYYDSNGRLSYINDALGQSTSLFYDSAADIYKITRVEDPFGRFAYFQYDQQGRLQKITDIIGITSAFTYDSGSFITDLTTPYGVNKFSYGQDGTNGARWLYATDPNGDHQYVYSPPLTDNVSSIYTNIVDTLLPTSIPIESGLTGYRNTFYFDKAALSIGTTNDFANATVYHWLHDNDSSSSTTESGIIESTKGPLQSRIYYWYPGQTGASYSGGISLRQPSIVTRLVDNPNDPSSPWTQTYQYTYNANGRLTQYIDPAGRTTIANYYSNGIDLQSVQQAANGGYDMLEQFGVYNSRHDPTTFTNAAGMTYNFSWNSFGQLTNAINPKGESVAYNHNTNGYLKSIVRSGGGLSATNSFGYDFYERLNASTNAVGYYLTAGYDNLNRLTNVTYPDGTFKRYVYNRLDLFAAYDRAGNRTAWTYDGTGRPLTMRDRLNRLTQYSWCGCGGLESITDPMGHTTTWTRDVNGRVTEKIYQDSTTIQYAYQTYGDQLQSVTDAKSQVKNYIYNVDNTLSNLTYTSAIISTPPVTFTYDTNYQRIVSMTDGTGMTSYGYYPAGVLGANQLMAETNAFVNAITIYKYDALGRATNCAIDGVNESVAFDALDRSTNHLTALGNFGMAYTNVFEVNSIAYPNGQTIKLSYFGNAGDQQVSQILNISGSSQFNYQYNALDRVTQMTEQSPSYAFSYSYDAEGELTDAIGQGVPSGVVTNRSYSYVYDLAGNRINEQAETNGLATHVSQSLYNSLNQLTNRAGSSVLPVRVRGTVNEFSYVTVSNQTALVYSNTASTNQIFTATLNLPSGSNAFSVIAMDVNGNRATNKYSVNVAGDTAKTYRYDVVGNCTNVSMAGTNIWYEWDAQNRMVAINTYVTNTATLQRSELTYDGYDRWVQVVEKTNGVVGSTKRFVWCGSKTSQERSAANAVTKRFFNEGEQIAGTNYYFNQDALGSVRAVTDGSGTIVAQYDYDPYGRQTKLSGTMDADFGFAGYYHHAPSCLYLTVFRAYDPDRGWLNRDPIEEEGGLNLYAYVDNNPVNEIDPLGLIEEGAAEVAAEPTLLMDNAEIQELKEAQNAKKAADACKKAKELKDVRDKEDALNKLKDIEKAQEKIRKGKNSAQQIDRITKSEQNAKNQLKNIANDPSSAP